MKNKLILGFLTICFLLAGCSNHDANAATACPEQYAGGKPPHIINTKLLQQAREVCFSAYGVLHSGLTKTPIYAGEYLTPSRVAKARALPREGSFHAEKALPEQERAELADYAYSGYDRGHLAPNGDMPDPQAQAESFSLANMTPQDANNNRGIWAGIEATVRTLATDSKGLYVVSGPLFLGKSLKRLNGRVYVPTHYFKAVYIPSKRKAAAYLVENIPGRDYKVISIQELTQLAGLDPFPSASASVKQTAMALPVPEKIEF